MRGSFRLALSPLRSANFVIHWLFLLSLSIVQINLLPPKLAFPIALLAIVLTVDDSTLLAPGSTLSPPTHGRFATIVDTSIVSLVLLMSAASIACRSSTSTMTMRLMQLHVQHLVVGVSAR